ncbi:MAG: ABC transporter permease [Anaerolineae bacterium]|nr:MAG: ABC transporter permease [Anaerolineae bacterium]
MAAIIILILSELRHDWRRIGLNIIAIATVVFAFLLLFTLGDTLGSLTIGADISRNLVVIEGDIVDPSDATLDKSAIQAAEELTPNLVSNVSPMIYRHLRINDKLVQLRAAELEDWLGIHHLSLADGRLPDGPGEVAITRGAASILGGDLDSNVTIFGSDFRVVGLVEPSGTPFASIWIDLDQAVALYGPTRGYQFMLVEVAVGADGDVVKSALEADPRINSQYQVFFEDKYTRRNTQAMKDLQGIAQALSIISLLAIILGTYNATSLQLSEKERQLGILRAIGFGYQTVYRLQLVQTLFQSLAGFIIGLIAATIFLVSRGPSDQLFIFGWPLIFDLTLSTVLMGLIFTLLFAWLGTLLATRRMLASSPATALRA